MPHAPHRKSDAIIRVCQHNGERTLRIIDANLIASQLLGYNQKPLQGRDLRDLLPGTIYDRLEEELVFDEEHADIGEILRKMRHFSLKTFTGDILPLELKVYADESMDSHPVFSLVLREHSVQESIEAGRQTCISIKGFEVIDQASGLPNYGSFIKDMEMVRFYVGRSGIAATLAIMKLDDYDAVLAQHGQEAADKLLRDIADRTRVNLRYEDSIGRLAPDQIGIILMEASEHAATIALNRLRWNLRSQAVELPECGIITPSVSIGYRGISERTEEEELFLQCNTAMAMAVKQGGNHIQLAASM